MPMPRECPEVQRLVAGFSLVKGCDRIGSGALRIATPFTYPDTSNVDIFIENVEDLTGPRVIVSDLGQTTDFLLNLKLAPWGTRKRKQVVGDICASLGVQSQRGVLSVELSPHELNRLSDAIVRVSQACIRVADLCFTKRLSAPGVFKEEVEEFLSGKDLEIEADATFPGIYGRQIEIDFAVRGRTVSSLVQSMSTAYPSASHQLAVETFTKWHDLAPEVRHQHQLITIYNSDLRVFRDDDLTRLREYSAVFGFPVEEELLAAAIAA